MLRIRSPKARPKRERRVRTLFFGTSEFAVPSLRVVAQETTLCGVVTQPDRPAGRGHKLTPTAVKKAALEYAVPVYEPTSLKAFIHERESTPYHLFVLASYGKILPAQLLALPALGSFNVHPSLLPQYRGATPVQTALLNGDSQTGVTIMMMDAGMDTGPVVLQERTPIGGDENYGALHDRLAQLGAGLLKEALQRAARGGVQAEPQRGQASVTKPIGKNDLEIDWNWDGERIVNVVRAYSPQPAARAELFGVPIKIRQARRVAWPADIEAGLPGQTAIVEDSRSLFIQCRDGAIQIMDMTSPNGPRESGYEFYERTRRSKGAPPPALPGRS